VKVLLVLNWFLKYGSEQAVGLSKAGADVQVLCQDKLAEFGGNRAEWQVCIDEIASGTGREPWVIRGSWRSTTAALDSLVAARRARSWKPDVVHVHPNASPALYAAVPRAPVVLTVHDVTPHPGQVAKTGMRRLVETAWERRASGFVLHGEALRVQFAARPDSRPTAAIPHGVNPAQAPDPVPARPTLLFFGRLEPYKGLGVLMRAMPIVWTARPETELVIAGRGPSASELLEDRRIRKVSRYVPEAEVEQLFGEARLLVAPYTEGSQSGVVSLACARGLPSIVTSVGALPSLVVEPSQVVAAGDPEALAHALITHLDHTQALRKAVHDMARRELSWDSVGARTIEFYLDLARNR
jgi:glycosyltransferase involved in cell wall biosynthesis